MTLRDAVRTIRRAGREFDAGDPAAARATVHGLPTWAICMAIGYEMGRTVVRALIRPVGHRRP